MARVVQQQSNPPYLLIIFVFLFLVATTVAVLVYLENDKNQKALTANEQTYGAIVSSKELTNDPVKSMVDKYKKAPHGQAVTAIGQYDQEVGRLTQIVSGTEKDFASAETDADTLFKQIGSQRGLVPELKAAYDRLAQEAAHDAEANTVVAKLQTDLAEAQGANDKIRKDADADREKLNKDLAAADEKLKAAQDERSKALDDLKKDADQKESDLNKNLAEKTATIALKDKTIEDLQRRIKALEIKNEGDGNNTAEGGEERTAVGKISSAKERDGICYIDVGAKDQVKTGLTFSVFPATGLMSDKQKGSIEVIAVQDDVSTCRILSKEKGAAILPGDLIVNPAFSRSRTHTFVVEGLFDLHRSGRATVTGTEEVRALIAKAGGKVVKDVSPLVDYVVMGEEPPLPSKELPDEPPQVRAVREQQTKELKHYQDTVRQATDAKIPILNANRFLSLIGFTATDAAAAK